MKTRLTANAAASQTRAEINRKIKRILKRGVSSREESVLLEVASFIADMALRAGKKAGGLGRK